MDTPKIFVDGLIYKTPRTGAPDFVIGGLSVNAKKFFEFLKENKVFMSESGWFNIDIKKSKKNTYYTEINTWKPPAKEVKPDDGRLSDGSLPPAF